VQNGEATIGDGTKSSISTNTSGVIIVPSLLGGRKVTSIGRYAFLNCIELTKVAIPSNVTSISEFAFYGCAALESVIIPASVTDIGFYAFDGCNGICDVTVPGWKCRIDFTSVTNLVISSGITSIENGAFQRCAALTNVTIPGSVTSIGAYAFYCCYGLTSLTIPTSVTSLGYGAFMHCEALCNVSIPSGVTSIEDGVFYGCNEIRDAVLPGWLCGIDSDVITNVVISEGTTDIKDFGFYVCDNLRCITISPSVTNIGRYAFHCCKDLKGVIIPSSVINISEEAFSRNNALTEMNIPSSVKNIGDRAFQLCGNLNRLMICEGVERIGTFAFDECAGLTTVVIPASVTNVGFGAFNGCDGIRDVTVPGWKCRIDFTSVTNLVISNGATSIDAFAFNGSKNLMSVTIPIGVTYIGDSAFRECSSLSKVVLPSGVEVIGDHAFGDCAVLSSMSIPSTVTTIRSSAFDGCSGLMALLLPSSLAYIGENAFVNCHSLNSIDFEGTPPEGVKDAQIKADAAIRYNVNYEDAWLPIIEECKWTNATSYEPVPRPVMFAAVNGEVSIGSYFYTNVAVYGVLPEARRDGCTFAGWYTSLDGTNRVNAFSAVDPRVKTLYARWVEDDVALYAQWGANRYSVSFNANGGEGDMEAQPFLYDQVQGLTGARFTKTGYSFKGWSTSADGEVVYKDGESVSNLTAEAGFAVALFAKWEKVIDVLPEEVEEWVGYTLAPKFKKAGETNSQYRKRFEATYGDDYSAAFFKETGKIGHDGMRLQVWHDYVAGTDPLDEKSMFTATITLVDGVPRVSYLPELTEEQMSLRTYTTLGKKHLQDAAWTDITNAGDEERKLYNFFKVTVEMK